MELKSKKFKLTTLDIAVAKKGVVMEINNSKNRLSRIIAFFVILLFTMCLTMNGLLGGNYNLYEPLDKTTVIETWTISESIAANQDSDNETYYKSLFLNNNNSHTETITKNTCPISIIAAIPKGFSLFPFLIIVYLFIFLTLFSLLPNNWTLIDQKIRLDI